MNLQTNKFEIFEHIQIKEEPVDFEDNFEKEFTSFEEELSYFEDVVAEKEFENRIYVQSLVKGLLNSRWTRKTTVTHFLQRRRRMMLVWILYECKNILGKTDQSKETVPALTAARELKRGGTNPCHC
ncbi:unnamed protein product [Orchesella dallaii]|uniref:Uncharacterized protein n=1 Tax=Orchesella dallaii TaxID=48710 RepID=A0ABP1PWJ2_9HEXA